MSLVEIDELERRFDTRVTSIRLDPTGTELLYIDDEILVHETDGGARDLGAGYVAAWLAS